MYGRPASVELLQRDGRPRHLHQAECLPASAPAGGGEQDVGHPAFDRRADAGDECGADGDSHRSAHEREILHADDDLMAVEPAAGVDQSVALAVGGTSRLQAVGVALGIPEPQRILADLGRGQKLIFRGVEQLLEALRRADPVVEVAARADAVILFPFLDEHHRPALGALCQRFSALCRLGRNGMPLRTRLNQLIVRSLIHAGIWEREAAMSMIAARGPARR